MVSGQSSSGRRAGGAHAAEGAVSFFHAVGVYAAVSAAFILFSFTFVADSYDNGRFLVPIVLQLSL